MRPAAAFSILAVTSCAALASGAGSWELPVPDAEADAPPGDCPAEAWTAWGERCQMRQLEIKKDEKLGDDGLSLLAAAFASGDCKTSGLHAPSQSIGPAGFADLAAAIGKGATKIGGLSLPSNTIGDEGLQSLSKAMVDGETALVSISLNENQIGDDGAVALAQAIETGKTKLAGIGLGDNQIGDRGLEALATACGTGKTKLTSLNLFNNKVGDAGMVALASALETGTCGLTTLDLSRKPLPRFRHLPIAHGLCFTDILRVHARTVAVCQCVTTLRAANIIGDEGAIALAAALKTGKTQLKVVYLWGNKIEGAGKAALEPYSKIIDWSAP